MRNTPTVPPHLGLLSCVHFVAFVAFVALAACSSHQPPPEQPTAPVATSRGPRFPAVYIDMDGTLLDSNHAIRPATLEALSELRACGGRYGIATGRTLEQVRPYLEQLDPDLPFVLFNGAVVMDPSGENIVSSTPLPLDHVEPLLTLINQDERVLGVFVQYGDRTLAFPGSPELEALAERIHTRLERACESPESCLTGADGEPEPPLKLLVVTRGDVAMELVEALRPRIPEGVRAVVGFPSAIEITAEGADKASAIGRVLESEGLSREGTVVIGDSGNDVEMVTEFPVSVAMEECHPRTCAAALFRAGSNDSDAIARIIRSLVMGPSCELTP